MRPTYETEKHLQRERNIISSIEELCGVRLQKTPKYYHIDYCMIEKNKHLPQANVLAWVEIRGKEFAKESFPTFYTSLEKYISVARMSHLTGKPAFILANWKGVSLDGQTEYHKVDYKDIKTFEIKMGGRTTNSRGDEQDIEPVIHIPTRFFKPLTSDFLTR